MAIEQGNVPYGRQWIEEEDIAAVGEVLRSDWLTTGPKVPEFETKFAVATGAAHAVALSSGTAALHACMAAIGVQYGDEVVVPAMTFAATANAVVYQGGTPVFADVEADTLLVDPSSVESLITPRTKAIVAVDYAGQPCDYEKLRSVADRHGLWLIADACHSLGAQFQGRPVGTLADLSAFSLHPVKPITSGEGGVVTTHDSALAEAMRRFRNHGITLDHRQREAAGVWDYDMVSLGFNYRLTDFQCALAMSQLGRVREWVETRRRFAQSYDADLATCTHLMPLAGRPGRTHAYHLYVVRVGGDPEDTNARTRMFSQLRQKGIGAGVHYRPVHLHSFYRNRFDTADGMCPVAEEAYRRVLTLPLFPRMTEAQRARVVSAVQAVAGDS